MCFVVSVRSKGAVRCLFWMALIRSCAASCIVSSGSIASILQWTGKNLASWWFYIRVFQVPRTSSCGSAFWLDPHTRHRLHDFPMCCTCLVSWTPRLLFQWVPWGCSWNWIAPLKLHVLITLDSPVMFTTCFMCPAPVLWIDTIIALGNLGPECPFLQSSDSSMFELPSQLHSPCGHLD